MKFSWSEPAPSPPHDDEAVVSSERRASAAATADPRPVKVLDAPPRHRPSPRTPRRKKGGAAATAQTSRPRQQQSTTTPALHHRSRGVGRTPTGSALIYRKDVKSETAALMHRLVSEKQERQQQQQQSSGNSRSGDSTIVPQVRDDAVRSLVAAAAGRSKEIERRQRQRMAAVLNDTHHHTTTTRTLSPPPHSGLVFSKPSIKDAASSSSSSSRVRSGSIQSARSSSPKKMEGVHLHQAQLSPASAASAVGAFSWSAVAPTSLPLSDGDDTDSSSSMSNSLGRHRFHNKRKVRRKGGDEGSNASWSLPSSDASNSSDDDDSQRRGSAAKRRTKSSSSILSNNNNNGVVDGYSSFLRVYKAKKALPSSSADNTVMKRVWKRLSDSDKDIWRKEEIRQLSVKRLKSDIKREILTPSNFTSWCSEMRSLRDPHLGPNKIVDVTLLMAMLQRLARHPHLDSRSIFKDRLKKDILPMLQPHGGWGPDLDKATTGWLLPIAKSIKNSLRKLIIAAEELPSGRKKKEEDEEEGYLSSVKEVKALLGIDTSGSRSPKRRRKEATSAATPTTTTPTATTVSTEDQRSKVRAVLQSKALADEEVGAATEAAKALEEALWREYGDYHDNNDDDDHDQQQSRQVELKEYYSRVRTLTFNLRQNGRLRSRLLEGGYEYGAVLAVMSVEEMATDEQQASRRDVVERGLKAVVRQEKESLVEDRQKIMDLHQRNDSPEDDAERQHEENTYNNKKATVNVASDDNDNRVGEEVV